MSLRRSPSSLGSRLIAAVSQSAMVQLLGVRLDNLAGEVPQDQVAGLTDDLAAINSEVGTKAATSDLAADTGSAQIGFKQSGTGAISRDADAKLKETVSVKDFGATGDGSTDDSAAINATLSSGASTVHFPKGTYYIESAIEADGNVDIVAAKGAEIKVATGLLKGVRFGATTLYGGTVRGLRVVAEGRSGDHNAAVDDYGFEFLDVAQATFYDLEARWFRYPFHWNAQTGKRVSYCDFFNPQAIGGYRNFSRQVAGTGFTNDINHFGGRCYPSASTETHAYIDGGNHIRFYGTRMEGGGASCVQAVYDNGHSNVYDACRTEGTWSADDYVIGSGALYTNVRAVNLYATVTDGGLNSFIQTGLGGSKQEVGIGDKSVLNLRRTGANATSTSPILKVVDTGTSSGQSYGVEVRLGRAYAGTGYTFRGVRDSDGADLFYSNQSGGTYTARYFEQGQSAYNLGAFKQGDKYLWWDSGRYRVKSGSAPGSATDGNQVQIVTSGATGSRPTTRDTGFEYFDTTLGKPIWWNGTGWVDATGTAA